VFTRRTGVEPDAGYVALAWPTLERRNAHQPYEAEPGLLADALDGAGRGVEVIGNADGSDTAGPLGGCGNPGGFAGEDAAVGWRVVD
jgi:hypothetical protein